MYELINQIVLNINGFTVNDILETDYYRLLAILNSNLKGKQQQEVQSLNDFVKTI